MVRKERRSRVPALVTFVHLEPDIDAALMRLEQHQSDGLGRRAVGSDVNGALRGLDSAQHQRVGSAYSFVS